MSVQRQELSERARWLGAVLWPSFFAAAVANMVCFALVDPLVLRDISFPGLDISREFGYSLGFFVFWLLTASSCAFTALLLRRPDAEPTDKDVRKPSDLSADG